MPYSTVYLQRSAARLIVLVCLSPSLLFSQETKSTGIVGPNLAEFTIPLGQPADATWNWNRPETPDNGGEYTWQVSVPNGSGNFSFGFFLYKLPAAKPKHGNLQTLFKAGQTSVFIEDAQGRGELIPNANVIVSAKNGRLVIRITDPDLIHRIFSGHPETATIHITAIGSNFELVKIQYQNQANP